jgi:uncharacterized OsmC-like protein
MSTSKYSISSTSLNDSQVIIRTRGYEFLVGEAKANDGVSNSPRPVEFLLASYAGCLSNLLYKVAREKGIELRGVVITAEGEIDTRKYAGIESIGRAGFSEIRFNVQPDADVSPEVLLQLVREAEERCPISDNIRTKTPVNVVVSKPVYLN